VAGSARGIGAGLHPGARCPGGANHVGRITVEADSSTSTKIAYDPSAPIGQLPIQRGVKMKPKSHALVYRYVSPRNIERENGRSGLDATSPRSVPSPDPRCLNHAATGASGGSAERRTYSRSGDPRHLRIRSGFPRIPIDLADSILSPSPATVARTWPPIVPSPGPGSSSSRIRGPSDRCPARSELPPLVAHPSRPRKTPET
jgi:hypothetical protein